MHFAPGNPRGLVGVSIYTPGAIPLQAMTGWNNGHGSQVPGDSSKQAPSSAGRGIACLSRFDHGERAWNSTAINKEPKGCWRCQIYGPIGAESVRNVESRATNLVAIKSRCRSGGVRQRDLKMPGDGGALKAVSNHTDSNQAFPRLHRTALHLVPLMLLFKAGRRGSDLKV